MCSFITKLIRDIILLRDDFFMTQKANVDFEAVQPHNSDIQRFRLFRPELIKKVAGGRNG